MKQIIKPGFFILCISLVCSISQTTAQIGVGSLNTLTDGNGNPLLSKKAAPVEGVYLFNKNYLPGVLYLDENHKPVTGNKFKLNLQDSKLYFMDAAGTEMEVAGPVKRVEFTGAGASGADAVFEKGFPPVDRLGRDNFYQVIISGKALLLMDTKFAEVEYKEFNSASTARRTDKLVSYYGVLGNRITRLGKPEDVLLLLADKTQQVSDFMKQENSKVKKQADLEKIFRHYNGLQ
jgi:hypothetical protein